MPPGRTVITGVPVVAFDRTTNAPPNTEWVAVPSASSPITSLSSPLPVRTASRAAISLPSADAASTTAAGDTCSTSAASTSTVGLIR